MVTVVVFVAVDDDVEDYPDCEPIVVVAVDDDVEDNLVEYEANGESRRSPKRVNGANRAVPLLYSHSHLM